MPTADARGQHRSDCRRGCGACCIAPSITTPMPGLPQGKPAGVACPHLTIGLDCALFDDPRRPRVCASLRPSEEMCGDRREHALEFLARLEARTAPALALAPESGRNP